MWLPSREIRCSRYSWYVDASNKIANVEIMGDSTTVKLGTEPNIYITMLCVRFGASTYFG
jgi:hypothetical protein